MFDISNEYQAILESLKNGIVPEAYPKVNQNFREKLTSDQDVIRDVSALMVRDEIIRLSGFAMVAYDWVHPLAEWIGSRKCLEVMCGSGILSKTLRDCGVSVIATDIAEHQNTWIDIEYIDCLDAVKKYGLDIDIVICSWPPYQDEIAHRLLLCMREINPNLIMLYIGENYGGATACDAFFKTAEWIDDVDFEKAVQNFTQIHEAIHDNPYLLK